MKPTEIVMLTGYLRAHFPSQPVDEYTTEALEELLAPYPPADCRRAVLQIAERGERWCSPTDIKAEVKRVRAKRIADFGNPELPSDMDPDNTLAYRRWLRETQRAIADGQQVESPKALKGAIPMPKGLADGMARFGQLPADVTRAATAQPEGDAS